MLTLRSFLTESTNAHMEHLEDNILNGGVNGARQTINFLQSLRDMLSGKSERSVNVSVKWDGAPAVFAGVDPVDGKFFVAKKSIFNTEPKVYKTEAEVDADTSGDLSTKLKLALRMLPDLGIKSGVYQGDFLFSDSDLKTEKIDGEEYITFHPNTIVYAVPVGSKLAKTIQKSKIGIVWHTTYTVGSTLKDLKASFGKSIASKLKTSSQVWSVDAEYKDLSGKATMTADETKMITGHLSLAGKVFKKIPAAALNQIANDEEFRTRMKAFMNTYIRQGKKFPSPQIMTRQLANYIDQYYQKEIDKKKTPKAKAGWEEKRKLAMKPLSNPIALQNIFTLMQHIIDAKQIIVNKMNQAAQTRTFLKTKTGWRVTGEEGYVAIDHVGKQAVKLVDRLEFSTANFGADVLKGWQR